MIKRFLVVSSLIGVLLFVSSCSNNKVSDYVNAKPDKDKSEISKDYTSFIEELKDLKKVELDKKMFSWGKSYEIKTDNDTTYYLKGKNFYWSGDSITMTNEQGDTLLVDNQISRKFSNMNRMAEITDSKGSVMGYIGEEQKDMFSWFEKLHLYNQDGVEMGVLTYKMSLTSKYEITDAETDEILYIIKGKFSLGSKLSIDKVKTEDNKIPMEQAIISSLIMNEIKIAESNKSSSNNNTSK